MEEVWRRDWPDKSFNYYKCRVKGKGICFLYFHVCRESGKKRWLDNDWNEVDNVIEWTTVKLGDI